MRIKLAPMIALALAISFGLGACSGGGRTSAALPLTTGQGSPSPAAPAPSPSPSSTPTAAPSTATPIPLPPSTPALTDLLKPGDKGPRVLALQKRLTTLGFWISGSDGTYGETTQQAVMAVQKAEGLERDGVAGPITMKAIAAGVKVTPRSRSGHWLEIDKARQLLMIVTDGKVSAVLNTSTGSDQPYQQAGQTYTANTPTGTFAVFRQVDGDDPGPLGDLWRPKYFNGGIAVHGSPSIPGYPASHGCARLSNAAIDWIWSSGQAPIGTKVWVY